MIRPTRQFWLAMGCMAAAIDCNNPPAPVVSAGPIAGSAQPAVVAGSSGATALPAGHGGASGSTPAPSSLQAGTSAVVVPLAGSGTIATPAAGATGGMPAGGAPAAAGGCETFDSTYAAIQKAIFEKHGCASDACHGSTVSGGLDLRAGASYKSLFQVKSQGHAAFRLQPGAPTESYLYMKLQAATTPGSVQIANSPMPVGLPALSVDELDVLRLWIQGGAPETGSVGDPRDFGSTKGIAARLNACLPPADPIHVAPLDPPAPTDGIQFVTPKWVLAPSAEREICVASYYDFSDRVPAQYKSPDGTKFYTKSSRLRQDPGSHHFVLSNPGISSSYASDPSFGAWTCRGDREGQTCDPLNLSSCGGEGICSSEIKDLIACIGFGPLVLGSDGLLTKGMLENVQTANQYLPPRDGVYRELPIKGFLYHNMHAFNLTDQPYPLQGRLNVEYASDRRRRLEQAIDYSHVYMADGIAPYTTKELCATHIAPQGAEMIRLTSHTHKRGKRFRISMPENHMIYESTLYSDPLYQNFDPGIVFDGATDASRTLTACSLYNNGVAPDGSPDPDTVTRYSRLPDRTQCTPVACVSGKIGAPCKGATDNASCDSAPGAQDGFCDACPITGGPTTENEMFVIMPWYVLAEGQ
ncbi:MAG: hypothetical protein RL701_6796 [Pseudomonadota bacterium]